MPRLAAAWFPSKPARWTRANKLIAAALCGTAREGTVITGKIYEPPAHFAAGIGL